MARHLRLSFEDATYHITARGNRKEKIFYSDKDKVIFLNKIKETFEKYSIICYAYCLMNNHYHLFIKTPLANIADVIHYLNTSYSNWFRAKYKIVGPVFQGRYKSIIVDEDSYSLILSVYIHLNPVRARMASNIKEYPWSSFLDYIGRREPLNRLDTTLILNQLDNDLIKARKKYERLVLENVDMKSPLESLYKNVALGDELFRKRIDEKIKAVGRKREIPETKFIESYTPDEIIDKISKNLKIEKSEIFKKQRGNMHHQLALYLIKRYTPMSLREIGKLFDMDYAAVSQAVKRFEDKTKRDKEVLGIKERLIKRLKGN
ncbi:MAG: transposase [bacterium]